MHILFHNILLICNSIRGTVVRFVLLFNTKRKKQIAEKTIQKGAKLIYIFRNMDVFHGNGQRYAFKDTND
jgi:hypothetical protein